MTDVTDVYIYKYERERLHISRQHVITLVFILAPNI